MNPLAALSVDRNTLVGENYRPQGGNFYPSIQPLAGEKPREAGTSVPLRYDLLYKPDLTLLDGQKSANGYAGLYKSSPPGLQKPILVPAAGGDGLGLNHQSLSSVKQSELCLNGAGSFPRLPWFSPYTDATMYPFLDMAYKASFLSQPLPFIHQQLAYQSLCGSSPGEERPFYLSHYTPAHISSPLGPPLRIHTATATPALLSTLSCGQDKTIQGLGPQVPRDHSAFRTSPQVHQEPSPQTVHLPEQHLHGSSGNKSTQPTSTSTLTSKGAESGVTTENSSTGSANSSSTIHPPCSISPSQPFNRTTTDIHKTFNRGTTSSSTSISLSHSSTKGSVNSELCSSKKSENKTKDAGSGRCNVDKAFSPASSSLRRDVLPKPARNAVENFLDLSAKELEGAQNGIPSKLEALAKLGYLPPSSYGVSGNQDMPIKEGVITTDKISPKKKDHSDKINTVSVPWVISSSSLVTSSDIRRSQILKNRNTDHQPMSQKQQVSATSIGNDILNYATVGRPSELCPPSKSKVEQARIPSSELKKVGLNSKGENHKSPGKHNTTSVKLEVPEIQSRHKQKQHLSLENGTPSGQIYGDSYLPPGLAYTSRYIPYSVAENISLQHLATGKAPIYPQLGLLGTSFYTPRMAANHGISYGMHPSQGEVLAYPNSQSIAPPSISSLSCPDQQEFTDKTRNSELYKNKGRLETDKSKKSDNEKNRPPNETKKASSKSVVSARDDVFIDLVHDETEHVPSASRYLSVSTKNTDYSTKGGSSSNPIQERMTKALDLQATKPKEEQLLDTTQGLIPHQNTSHHPAHCEENPEEPEPLSPHLDIPEQQTMRCARTSIQFCGRKSRALCSAGDLMRGYSNSSIHGVNRMGACNESKLEIKECKNVIPEQIHSSSDHSLDHVGKDIFENSNNSNTHHKPDGLVCTSTGSECKSSSSQVSSCMSFNPGDPSGAINRRTPLYVNVNPRSPEFDKRKPNGQRCLSADSEGPKHGSLTPSTPTPEPINYQSQIDENGNPAASECESINPRLHYPEKQNTARTACGNLSLRASTCKKKCCGEVSNVQLSKNDQICASNHPRTVIHCSPPGSNHQRCPNNEDLPAGLFPESPVSDGLSSNMIDSKREETNSDFASCGDGSKYFQESMNSPAEEENQHTIIAKHITISSGGKSESSNVWANSSKLRRGQQAEQVRPAFQSHFLPQYTVERFARCCSSNLDFSESVCSDCVDYSCVHDGCFTKTGLKMQKAPTAEKTGIQNWQKHDNRSMTKKERKCGF